MLPNYDLDAHFSLDLFYLEINLFWKIINFS